MSAEHELTWNSWYAVYCSCGWMCESVILPRPKMLSKQANAHLAAVSRRISDEKEPNR